MPVRYYDEDGEPHDVVVESDQGEPEGGSDGDEA